MLIALRILTPYAIFCRYNCSKFKYPSFEKWKFLEKMLFLKESLFQDSLFSKVGVTGFTASFCGVISFFVKEDITLATVNLNEKFLWMICIKQNLFVSMTSQNPKSVFCQLAGIWTLFLKTLCWVVVSIVKHWLVANYYCTAILRCQERL